MRNTINTALLLLFLASPMACTSATLFVECDTERGDIVLEEIDTEQLVGFDTDALGQPETNQLCGDRADNVLDNRFNPYLGGTEGVDIVVEHFSNLRCPHCAEFASFSRELWEENPDINRRVRIYFHHYPPNGYEMYHAAAIAAGEQGMEHFWTMHDYIYSRVDETLPFLDLRDYARETQGLDMALFDDATDAGSVDGMATYALIDRDKSQGVQSCAASTPAVYVCGQLLYDWRELESIIRSYLDSEK